MTGDIAKRVAKLHRQGMGVNAIGAKLQAEGLPGSAGSVSRLLREQREETKADTETKAPESPKKKRSGKAPDTGVAHGAGSGSAGATEVDNHAPDDLDAAERAHAQLVTRFARLASKIDAELGSVEPNWSLIRPLLQVEQSVLQDLVRTRVPRERKPEEDPAHAEAARVLVTTIRARVEAARRGRP